MLKIQTILYSISSETNLEVRASELSEDGIIYDFISHYSSEIENTEYCLRSSQISLILFVLIQNNLLMKN